MTYCINCKQELTRTSNNNYCVSSHCPLKGLLQVGVENCEYKTFHVTNDGFEMVEKPKRWKPDEGNMYFYIDYCGLVYSTTWAGDKIDEGRCAFGNCFKTREEAEIMRDKIKTLLVS